MTVPHGRYPQPRRGRHAITRNCAAAFLLALSGSAHALTDGPIRLIPLSDPESQLAIFDNNLALGALRQANETDLVINEFKDERGEIFYYIAQRSDPTALLNIQTGKLAFAVIPKDWWSAQWTVSEKDGIIKLISRWKPGIAIGLNEAGELDAVPENSQLTTWKAQALERDSRDGVDFSKAGLLAKPGSSLASNTTLQLVDTKTLNENTALLARQLNEGIYRFISFDGDIVLSLNVEKGGLGLSQIAPDWWSGHWMAMPSPVNDNALLLTNRWKPDLLLARDADGKLYAAKKDEVDPAAPQFQWNIATASGEIINKPKPAPKVLDERKLFTRQMLEVVNEEYAAGESAPAADVLAANLEGKEATDAQTVSSYPTEREPAPALPGSALSVIPDSPSNTVASYYAVLEQSRQSAGDEFLDATNITYSQEAPAPKGADAAPVLPQTSPVMDVIDAKNETAGAMPEPDSATDAMGTAMDDAERRLEENFRSAAETELAEQERIAETLNKEMQLASNEKTASSKDTVEPVIVKPGSREAEAQNLPSEETIEAAKQRVAEQASTTNAQSPDGQKSDVKAPKAAPAKPQGPGPAPENQQASKEQQEGKVPETKLAQLLKRIHGEVVTSNSNSEEVGPWQAYTKIYANDLLGKGETMWLIGDAFGWGKELKAVRGGIDLPLNKQRDWHMRYNFHVSNIKPTPVEDDFKWLDINEREQNLEVFKVSEKEGHRNETGVFFNHLDSDQKKQELHDDAPRDLSFSSRDVGLFTTGYFWKENEETKLAGNYYTSLSKGVDMFGASDYFEVRTEAEPYPLVWKGRFNIRHDWKKSGWHVAASAAAHYADRISEWHKHFALGGMNYASGFSSAEAAGEIGAGAWVEVGKAFPAALQLADKKIDFKLTPYARADIGHVHSRYIDPTDPLDYMRTTTLTSAMAGIRFDHEKWSFDVGYAVPLSGQSRFEDGEDGRFVFSSSIRW